MATEQVSLFDVGALGLFAAWLLCWVEYLVPFCWIRRTIRIVIGGSALLMLSALAWRGMLAHHVPLTSAYEFCLLFVLSITVAYVVTAWWTRWVPLGLGVLPIAMLVAAYARWGISTQMQIIRPLSPALQSVWLPIHVVAAAVAYGFFAVAAGAAMWWLVAGRSSRARELENASSGAIRVGFLGLTVSMISGAIWAQMAWGSFWSWDPKEVWTLVTWLIYAASLHVLRRKAWAGGPVMVAGDSGFRRSDLDSSGVGLLARWTSLQSLHLF